MKAPKRTLLRNRSNTNILVLRATEIIHPGKYSLKKYLSANDPRRRVRQWAPKKPVIRDFQALEVPYLGPHWLQTHCELSTEQSRHYPAEWLCIMASLSFSTNVLVRRVPGGWKSGIMGWARLLFTGFLYFAAGNPSERLFAWNCSLNPFQSK